MPWKQPNEPLKNVTPLPNRQTSQPPTTPKGRGLEWIQSMTPEAWQVARQLLDLKVTMEQERTKREVIQAQRDLAIRYMDAGAEQQSAIIEKEYAERAEFQRIHGELMKILVQQGNAEAALQFSQMLLDRAADRQMLKDIIAFRNQAASVGQIHLQIVEPQQ